MSERDLEVLLSLCTVHSVFERFDDTFAAIGASRSITMASTATQRAPNCFTHLHQLRKVDILGRTTGVAMTDWSRKNGVMKAFNIGSTEAAAALNLAKNVPLAFVRTFGAAGAEVQFRARLWHELGIALDCKSWSKGPILTLQEWTDDLKNDEYALLLLAQRIGLNWESTPKSCCCSPRANSFAQPSTRPGRPLGR